MQQAAILCVLPLVPRQQAGGLHRGSAGRVRRAPRGQYGAVCSFAVSQQWEALVGGPPPRRRWELPFRSRLPWGLHCHCALPCIHLVFYPFGGKIAKVADDHNSLETDKLVEERKTDGTNFERSKVNR